MPVILNSFPPGTFKYAAKRSRSRLHEAVLSMIPELQRTILEAVPSLSKKRKVRECVDAIFDEDVIERTDSKRPKISIEPEPLCAYDEDSFFGNCLRNVSP